MTKLHGGTYYRTVIKNVRLIVKCGICGHKQRLQFHHIKPTKLNGDSRGSSRRAYDIVKHPDCYIPLCYFCHQKVTSKELFIIEHKNDWGWMTLWWQRESPYLRFDWLGNDRMVGLINVI
jgi:hypothetical protein